MNKSTRRSRLTLTRSSLRPLQAEALRAVAGGRRRSDSDPNQSDVQYTCVPTSDTTATSLLC